MIAGSNCSFRPLGQTLGILQEGHHGSTRPSSRSSFFKITKVMCGSEGTQGVSLPCEAFEVGFVKLSIEDIRYSAGDINTGQQFEAAIAILAAESV